MKRILAILVLSAMTISCVAPACGASSNKIETDVAAQTETTKNQQIIKEEQKIEVANEEKPSEEKKEPVKKKQQYKDYAMPANKSFKSYMSYKALTSRSSQQYKLQQKYGYTGKYGIRQVDGRYCVAIGTFSDAKVGTYIDLILKNGAVIPCIVSDFKANVHTDSTNKVTRHNGCVSEFVVDMDSLNSSAKRMGDISYCNEKWKSSVKKIRVYKKNIFN